MTKEELIEFINPLLPFSYDNKRAYEILKTVLVYFTKQGINISNRELLRDAIHKLFNIRIINYGEADFTNQSYILTSNHLTDFDVLNIGLLPAVNPDIPKTNIFAKNAWAEDATLMYFFNQYYEFTGIDRSNPISANQAMRKGVKFFNDKSRPKHQLIFAQGTLSDINKNSIERIQQGPFWISSKTKEPILPIFAEYPSLTDESRIIIGKPYQIGAESSAPNKNKYEYLKQNTIEWRDKLLELQNILNQEKPVRKPILTFKHQNNNKPEDLHF